MENYNNIIIENIKDNYYRILKFQDLNLTLFVKNQCIYVNGLGNKEILIFTPQEMENIHGNTVNKILNDFINQYSFNDILSIVLKELEYQTAKEEYIKNNLQKIIDLKKDLSFLDKYVVEDRFSNEKYKIYHHIGLLEFSLLKNKYSSALVKINLTFDNINKFSFYFNNKRELKTKEEIKEILNNYINKTCINRLEEIKEEQKQKRIEELKQDALCNFMNNIKNKIVLFKYNKSYFIWRKNTRFSVGTGKSGKYYNCNLRHLKEMIENKNINDYVVLNNSTMFTNEELKKINFNKIIV